MHLTTDERGMPKRVFECQNPACGKIFPRYGKRHTPRPLYCSHRCAAIVTRPSDAAAEARKATVRVLE